MNIMALASSLVLLQGPLQHSWPEIGQEVRGHDQYMRYCIPLDIIDNKPLSLGSLDMIPGPKTQAPRGKGSEHSWPCWAASMVGMGG